MNPSDPEFRGGGVAQLDRPPEAPIVLLPHVEVDANAEPVLRIEPRLRARRIELRRAARRQRRRIAAAVLAVVALIGAAVGAVYSPLLAVDRIDVSGADHLSAAQVATASGISRGDRIVSVDLAAARHRVERLGWVRAARVERVWPDTVTIRVTERSPVATVEADGRRLLIAAGGVVVGPAEGLDAALPLVTIDGFHPRVGAHLDRVRADAVEMVGVLPAVLVARMSAATVTQAGEVVVRLMPRGEVDFGTTEDLERKIGNAEALLGGEVTLDCVKRIDLRIPNAPVLSRSC